MFREASIGRYYEDEPQVHRPGHSLLDHARRQFRRCLHVWVRPAPPSAERRKDEQFVYALEGGRDVFAGGESVTLGVEDLAILPPGELDASFRARRSGDSANHGGGGARELRPMHAGLR